MKIVIGYLFYDILNLYGESGNILALEKYLKENNIEYEIRKLTIEDEINFNELDFVYMGSGTDENEYLALENLKKYTKEINEQISNNKLFLVTGNAIELFGKERKDKAWNFCPGPDVEYQMYLGYLSELCEYIRDKYNAAYEETDDF